MTKATKNRITILLGAGAVLDWKAPSTSDLTKLVVESGFPCINDSTKVTKNIYDKLISSGNKPEDISFETIINIIEELIIYYSYSDNNRSVPSLMKIFYDFKFEDLFLNYSICGDGKEKHGFHLEIPIGQHYEWQHSGAINNESSQQIYFQQLLAVILTIIGARISKYAYHSNGFTKILTPENEEINILFTNWIKYLNPSNNILRIYTLNYERLFKILMLKSGIDEVFEGFECGEFIEAGQEIKPNVIRIIEDINSHCHYNIHGSTFWKIKTRDETKLINPEIYLKGAPQLQLNIYEQASVQIEKGKNILLSNIITGYQKAQKGFITPFKQMQAAFDKDCLSTDILYIIGYSFGDEHINVSIKTALKYNPKLIIYLIDPIYDEIDGKKGYEVLQERFIRIFTTYLYGQFNLNKIDEKRNQYFDKRINVYAITMKEFLTQQINENK